MFHHDAAYEAALRALNTAAYVRPFVLYFNLMDHARAPLSAALVRRGDRGPKLPKMSRLPTQVQWHR